MTLPWIWIVGALASGIVTHQILKPRLPVYKIEPLVGFPRIVWDDSQVRVGMPMSISMLNENFMEIDIYGLTFDMFYMDDKGSLLHVADIKDHIQALSKKKKDKDDVSDNDLDTVPIPPEALWKIPSRGNFTINDTLFVSMDTNLFRNLLGNSRFYSSLWKGSGAFWLPTTGVAHIKATTQGKSGIPATLSIICDNLVENLVVQGLSCILHDAHPGWSDLKRAASSIKKHALTKLRANLEGVVLGQQMASSAKLVKA